MVSPTVLKQMSQVIYGLLISNGRITMLEVSRWTEVGGSYRTIQRWYHSQLIGLQIMWILFTSQLWKAGHEYIAAADEVVFGKAFITVNENGGDHPFEAFINTAEAGSGA
jgi:putative transposase